ncbi:MAG: hypothetical protein IJE05_06130 [Clostridia bacterium]|nr:hypothetical protein [Clostridia bacterium]
MIPSYQKVLEMESITLLKLEQDKKALENIKKILYQEKKFIVSKLITYMKKRLNAEYFFYRIIDVDYNIADIIVKKDSKIFNENIEGKDLLNFSVEELINSKRFENKDEIIIIDLNFDKDLINLSYLCDSLNYKFLSYSKQVTDILTTFVDYVLNRNINKK